MAKKDMTLEEKLNEAIVKDRPYEVPGNWVWSKLRIFCNFIDYRGKTPNKTDDGIRLITAKNIKKGYISLNPEEFIAESDYDTWMTRGIPKYGDVIFTTEAPLGNVAQLFLTEKYALAQRAITLSIIDGMIQEYLKFVLLSPSIQESINQMATGTTVKGIKASKLKELPIPIPPLKEQNRIVNIIESLFEKLDKAKELIEEAREGFEKRKAAILEKAFNGELTKNWRISNDINSETLLNSILISNENIKKNFDFTVANELYDIPTNWSWIKLKDVCEKCKYGTSTKSQVEGKIPVLRMGNLQQGKLDWYNLVYTSDEDEISKYDLRKGDLLFNRTNSPELVGKTSIYNGEMEAIFAGYLIRVRVLDEIQPEYINYFMNSIHAKSRCMDVKSDGVSQSNINAEKLGDFDIPLPSTQEQTEIVRILNKLLEEESKIKDLTQLEEQIDLIKKSILAKAFRCELGTNCEGDESALELLKGILSEN
jgi:type I restriction enzyme S subunit